MEQWTFIHVYSDTRTMQCAVAHHTWYNILITLLSTRPLQRYRTLDSKYAIFDRAFKVILSDYNITHLGNDLFTTSRILHPSAAGIIRCGLSAHLTSLQASYIRVIAGLLSKLYSLPHHSHIPRVYSNQGYCPSLQLLYIKVIF